MADIAYERIKALESENSLLRLTLRRMSAAVHAALTATSLDELAIIADEVSTWSITVTNIADQVEHELRRRTDETGHADLTQLLYLVVLMLFIVILLRALGIQL